MTTKPDVAIREAIITDIPRLAPLFDAYRMFYEQPSDLKAAERFLGDRLSQQESVIFLAEIPGGEAIGFTQLYPTFSSVSLQSRWILNDLYVDPAYRRHGIAKELMQAAEDFALQTRSRGLVLQTAHDNQPARKLYESLGWEQEQRFVTYQRKLAGVTKNSR